MTPPRPLADSGSLRTSLTLGFLALAGCGGAGGGAELPPQIEGFGLTVERDRLAPTLRLFNFPDYMDPELLADFEAQYGVRVVQDFFDTNEAMIARLMAGGGSQFDLIVASDYAVEILAEGGLLQAVDPALLPNRSNLHPTFVSPPYDPQNQWAIPFQWGTTGIGIRSDRILGPDEEVATWALLFDPAREPGRFVLLDDPREAIGAALLYLGHSVNSTEDAELAQAEALLTAAAARAVAFTAASTGRDLLVAGEVALSHNHSGEIAVAAEERAEIRYLLPREGAVVWADNLVIPVASPNAYTALVFANFLLDAGNGARLTETIQYFSPNLAAWPRLADELRAEHESFLSSGAMERLSFIEDLGPDRRKYDDLWTRVKAGSGQ